MLEVFILLNLILITYFAVCNTILIPNNFEIEMAVLAYVSCKNISTAFIALLPHVNTNKLFTKKEFLDNIRNTI